MDEYDKLVTSQRKWMFYLLAIFVVGVVLTPYRQVFCGLLLGGIASFMNLWLLQRKVKDFGKAVAEKGTATSLGTFTRIVTSVVVVMIALRFESLFNIYAVIIGLASSYVVMMIEAFIRALIEANKTSHKH